MYGIVLPVIYIYFLNQVSMKIALSILIYFIILSCGNNLKKANIESRNSMKDTIVTNNPIGKVLTSNITVDTTRDSNGLYIPMRLLRLAVGQWNSEPITFAQEKNFTLKAIFNYTLKDDASGSLKLKIILDENNTSQELSLFFHIYPWGIANNRNNVNMFYIHLEKGILLNSELTNKNTEESIKTALLNLIEKSKGFTSVISYINQSRIKFQQIEPKGIYPNTLTRVE